MWKHKLWATVRNFWTYYVMTTLICGVHDSFEHFWFFELKTNWCIIGHNLTKSKCMSKPFDWVYGKRVIEAFLFAVKKYIVENWWAMYIFVAQILTSFLVALDKDLSLHTAKFCRPFSLRAWKLLFATIYCSLVIFFLVECLNHLWQNRKK